MSQRGIETFERPAVPVRNLLGEGPVRNEERFRGQMIGMLRARDREIEDLRFQVAALQVRVEALEAP